MTSRIKRSRKLFFFIFALFMGASGSIAVTAPDDFSVSEETARTAAENYVVRNTLFRKAAGDLPPDEYFRIDEIVPLSPSSTDRVAAYHISLLPRGYLVLSADRRLAPVICFSVSSDLVLSHTDGNALRAMLMADLSVAARALDRDAAALIDDSERPSFEKESAQWASLTDPTAPDSFSICDILTLVDPMVETRWSQWRHYNAQCPDDPEGGYGYDGKVPAGCIPVAGAQIARFHEWPPYGKESHINIDDNDSNLVSGSFFSDFRNRMHWTNMLDVYQFDVDEPSNAVDAVSGLIYSLGVAVDIDFGSFVFYGSIASLADLGSALNRNFFYEESSLIQRSGNESAFDSALRDEILAGRPVPASIPGHAVIIDGYMEEEGSEQFHVNYGWGGTNDGWYQLSAINSNSLQDALVGLMPRAIPLLDVSQPMTNVTGEIVLAWDFPDCRLPSLQKFRVEEGRLFTSNFMEQANDLDAWSGDIPPWEVSPDGYTGNCFRKGGEQGDYCLDLVDFVVPGTNLFLEFDYKAILSNDHFYVMTSIDGGYSWNTEKHLTATGWDTSWYHAAIDLSACAGQETMIRFKYMFESGDYWMVGGMWLDNIQMANVEMPEWSIVRDNIMPGTTTASISNRIDGDYYYCIDAYSGAESLARSPLQKKVVALAPELDLDNDGIPNGWESEYFDSPTGAVAEADADTDGFSNLGEYLAGTDPHGEESFFTVQSLEADPDGIAITWPSISNRTYALWYSTNLLASDPLFVSVTSGIAATPPTNRVVDTGSIGNPMGFYRIEIYNAP